MVDPEYPDICANTQSSVSAAYIYMGAHLPERYLNALFIGDYSKVRAKFLCGVVNCYHTGASYVVPGMSYAVCRVSYAMQHVVPATTTLIRAAAVCIMSIEGVS